MIDLWDIFKTLKDDLNGAKASVWVHCGCNWATCWNLTLQTFSSLMLLSQTYYFHLVTHKHVSWLNRSRPLSDSACCSISPPPSPLSLCVWVQASYCLGWQTKLRQGPLNVWWGNNWWNPASQHEREAVFLFWRVFMCALQRLSGSSSHCVAVWVCTLWDSCISRFEASVCVWGDEVRVGALVCGMTGWHHCVNEEREFNQRWMKWRSVLLARRKKSKLEKNEMRRCEWEND